MLASPAEQDKLVGDRWIKDPDYDHDGWDYLQHIETSSEEAGTRLSPRKGLDNPGPSGLSDNAKTKDGDDHCRSQTTGDEHGTKHPPKVGLVKPPPSECKDNEKTKIDTPLEEASTAAPSSKRCGRKQRKHRHKTQGSLYHGKPSANLVCCHCRKRGNDVGTVMGYPGYFLICEACRNVHGYPSRDDEAATARNSSPSPRSKWAEGYEERRKNCYEWGMGFLSVEDDWANYHSCLLYTSPSPRD